MSLLQVQVMAFILVASTISAFTGHRLAVADGTTPEAAWGWAGLSAAAAVVDLGVVYGALQLSEGSPSAARIGATVLGVMCALTFAVMAYGLTGRPTISRGRRWCITATTFTVAMSVFNVVLSLVN
ncbi:hypothetical protein [Streptomyces sennicomposti]|uniref:hypothetical protein n=1 Tax=Streptomyces sennicomposti TaxID=2873384 RepID=UPI001CA74DE8|nr:hypothetical protein [Streptomyces sennicomposti]MBY8868713.1 hypothetical protein [Streptomyces sennicomposti]